MTRNNLANDLSSNVASALNAAAAAPTIETILGANLADVWYAGDATLVSGAVSTVLGRKAGIAQPAPTAGQRPAYSASNAALSNKPTVNTARVGDKCLLNTSVPAGFLPVGSRPFVWLIGRVIANAPATDGSIITVRVDGNYDVVLRQRVDSAVLLRFYNGATRTSVKSGLNTAPHLLGSHIDGTAGSSVFVDNAVHGTVAAGTTATASDPPQSIGLGVNGVGSECEDTEVAVWGVCKNAPSALELAALYDLARTQYGVV